MAWKVPPEVIDPKTPTMSVLTKSQLNRSAPLTTTSDNKDTNGISATRTAPVTNAVANLSCAHLGPSTPWEVTVTETVYSTAVSASSPGTGNPPVSSARIPTLTTALMARMAYGAQRGSLRCRRTGSGGAIVFISWLLRIRRGG